MEFIQSLPYVTVNLEGLYVEALIDTGAEFSLIQEKFIQKNFDKFKKFIIPIRNTNLVTINHKIIGKMTRQLNFGVIIGGNEFMMEMLIIPDMLVTVIIGMNVLEKYNAVIDCENKVFNMGNTHIKWNENVENDDVEVDNNVNVNMTVKEMSTDTHEKNSQNFELNCPELHRASIKSLLLDHISLVNNVSTIARGYEHRLIVTNEESFHCKTYPVPHAYKDQVRKEIDDMLERGIIERARTNFINPIVVVKKKNGSIRLCLDARSINTRTLPQFESPSNIENLIGRLGNKTIFTKLDLKNSFWLIPLEKQSRKYTGFSMDGNVYQFRVVPFGLSTSCAALVRTLQIILNKYEEFCVHYVDDILIFSKDLEQHYEHIKTVLEELDSNGLKLNVEKCEFYKTEVKFLGYKVNLTGIFIDSDRLAEIKNYPRPKNLKTLRGFLGTLNYYRKFIPGIAEKSIALIELLKKGVKWQWTTMREDAFQKLKDTFYNNTILYHPDYKKKFILRTDASDKAIAGELMQDVDGERVPICFISKTLKGCEIRYTISEKEMAAIVFAVNKLKYYLIGNEFIIETDHAALTHLTKTRFANSRIYRWTLLLQEYNFTIKHIAGKENVGADYLTRKDGEAKFKPQEVMLALNVLIQERGLFSMGDLESEQANEELDQVRVRIAGGEMYRGYRMQEGKIIKVIGEKELYVTTASHMLKICDWIHRRYGHIGVKKVWLVVRENYYAKNDYKLIKQEILKCHVCCLGKYRNVISMGVIKSMNVENPLDLVAIDYLTNLVRSRRCKHILIVVDIFTKFTKLYPCVSCNTETSIRCIEEFIRGVGKPKKILADNATYFTSDRFKNHWREQEVKLGFCSIRHPQANPSERYIQEVIKYLRILLYNERHVNWRNYVERIESYINEVPSTMTGETPLWLMKRERPARPWVIEEAIGDIFAMKLSEVRGKLRRKSEAYVRRENRKVNKQTSFVIGDLVIIRALRVSNRIQGIAEKLLLPFQGPFEVRNRFGDTYELVFPMTQRIRGRFHIQMLYKYTAERGVPE